MAALFMACWRPPNRDAERGPQWWGRVHRKQRSRRKELSHIEPQEGTDRVQVGRQHRTLPRRLARPSIGAADRTQNLLHTGQVLYHSASANPLPTPRQTLVYGSDWALNLWSYWYCLLSAGITDCHGWGVLSLSTGRHTVGPSPSWMRPCAFQSCFLLSLITKSISEELT